MTRTEFVGSTMGFFGSRAKLFESAMELLELLVIILVLSFVLGKCIIVLFDKS